MTGTDDDMGTVDIRLAHPSDAGAIAGVHVRSWQEAYRGAFPDEFLDGLDPRDRLEMWRRNLGSDRLVTLVAERAGAIIGFALVGPDREDESRGEIYAIYLEPETWRRGIGRRLLAESEVLLSARGYTEAVLWVLDSNDRARRFYEWCGWVHDGTVKSEPIFGQDANEVRYQKQIPQRPSVGC